METEEFDNNFLNELDFASLINDDPPLNFNENNFYNDLSTLDDGFDLEPFGATTNFNGKQLSC
jgi:hypothetical protein